MSISISPNSTLSHVFGPVWAPGWIRQQVRMLDWWHKYFGSLFHLRSPESLSWEWGSTLEKLHSPHWVSLHRCLAARMHALGPQHLGASAWSCSWEHSQHHGLALRTLHFDKGRRWTQQSLQQQNLLLFHGSHAIALVWRETFFPPPYPFFFPFSHEAPSAIQLVIALVRWNGLAGEMTFFFSCLGPT